MRSTRTVAAVVGIALLIAGCGLATNGGAGEPGGEADPPTTVPPGESSRSPNTELDGSDPVGEDAPPPVTIQWDDQSRQLEAWTYCFGNVCADGIPPEDPFDVGNPDQVVVDFPLADWAFTATFREADAACPRVHHAELTARGDGTHLLEPVGDAGSWDVELFGRGDGDLATSFRWTTPVDGPVAGPEARVAVLADHDGRLDSYGVELALRQLATTPEEAAATITVHNAAGEQLAVIDPPRRDNDRRAGQPDGACVEQGRVYWDADVAATGRSSDQWADVPLSDGPFAYEVEVVLDGSRHVATATWPDDEFADFAPSVPLTFSPPLPGPADTDDGGTTPSEPS